MDPFVPVEDCALNALELSLDFACCACGKPVGVTVHCEGAGLASENPVASFKVPCPTCGSINQVCFSPDGTLHRVEPEQTYWRFPPPCSN